MFQFNTDPPDKLVSRKDDPNWSWLHEYWEGKSNEIYRVEIPALFCGDQFSNIANDVYKEKGLLLIALEVVVDDQ